MKRIIHAAVFVTVIFAALCVSSVCFAEEYDGGYRVSDDGLWRMHVIGENEVALGAGISDFGAYLGSESVISVPAKIDSYSVVKIEEYAFNYLDSFEEIIFPEGLKVMGKNAFCECTCVKRITLPESLDTIEENSLPLGNGVTFTVVKNSYAHTFLSGKGETVVTVESQTGSGSYVGWKTVDGKKYYYKSDGAMVKSSLITIDGRKYYFGSDGVMYKSRLISVNCKKYYLGSDGAAYTKRLISLSGKKYYLGADGVAFKSRLISLDGRKYYLGSDCVAYKSKLASVNGNKYYFGSDGIAYKSRLISVNSKKYYIGKDCIAYKSRFASLDGKKYYFGSDCVMRTLWRNIEDANGVTHKYYFGSDGVMRTGWQKIKLSDGRTYTYYFKSNGIMVTGKVSVDGKTEYFRSNGRYVEPGSPLLKKVYITPTGKKYHLDKNCCSNCTQVTLLEAQEMGLTPCKKCAGG